MKFFTLIMAILVIVLSCMPCADAAFAMDGNNKHAEVIAADQQKEHNDMDSCSPFCQCSCCASLSIHQIVSTELKPNIVSGILATCYLPSNLVEISLPIWQPPQLV